jgi:anaerobic selenocysteine-containing dehydrogenase
MPGRHTSRTMCPMNCHPTFCGMRVTVEDGRLIEVKGDPDNPDSEGFLCVRGRAAEEIVENPKRILHPLARTADNGWEEISWNEALARIVASVERNGPERVGLWACHGAVANDYGVFANAFLTTRLANMAGFQVWDPSMVCWGLGGLGIGLTGTLQVNTKEDMSANADLIVQWGSNQASQPNTARHIAIARKRGARVVAIDVRESDACRAADEHFIVRPGTDAALALAIMHVIVRDGLQDDDFIAGHTVGFELLREHLADRTPEWAAKICGVQAERIVDFARDYAETERAMLLLGGSSLYKDQNGWQASRAISCLPALTGKLGKAGAGLGPRHAGDAHGTGFNSSILNVEAKPPGNYVPNQISAIVDAIGNGDIQTMLLVGSNLTSSFPDANRVREGLQKMDLVVAHDLFMNDTIRDCADIVLPATAWLEDLGVKATTTHLYLMDRILEPAGETRSVADVARALAERLGIDDFYPWHDDGGHIDAVLDHPATEHATVASLREAGGIAAMNVSHVAHIDHQYSTPSGKVEFYSEVAASAGLPPLPSYVPRPASRFPLELRMGRTINHFHSFYDGGRALPALVRRDGVPRLWISPEDSEVRRISDGDTISMHNDQGTFTATANVTGRVPAGTVWIHDGWPGLNSLTSGQPAISDQAAALFPFSTGQAAYDAFVEVSPS